MRRDVSQWAIDNTDHPVAEQFTNLQFLKSHLYNPDLSRNQYSAWWNAVISTDSYVESPLIMAIAVYLDFNICVLRRPHTLFLPGMAAMAAWVSRTEIVEKY